ncbi:transcriptional regulator [Methylococcaceae bacterium HT4]|uniref:helix-turn-helix domain-containing protein n=1 Tax=Bathymodiolus platifrons methanotrophic gill symbiont TaxID=113268 RepID=UPI000B419C62|nr:transcriptional regulator [Bathymodiolus platifrons methanotrophic gill symbiont]TXK93043.1 transcriptional regulator [Methylococcaceae bacterium CS4]TXK96452.1 transcriptional regulator [Methylococcaceae bacterium CS5]TXL02556.1 transcriptional regulator [Methylococcaceae bacterium CS3]TXL04520.1 transcriptional regulator [Methylococcaceae bacterium CS1]TXL09681.1 transcriptional regulator [Methylococcaceae bacterium CS2]TXL11375.1 transcriptional regulator [Methylococcaceae bacterium HT4
MNIHPIKTENDYRNTLQEIEGLMMAKTGSIEGDRLDVLVTLVEDYERKHYPIDFPDPIEAIKFAMEQRSLTVKDLVPMIGQTNRVYEILNRKRQLTLPMIKRLHKGLGIPAESLLSN